MSNQQQRRFEKQVRIKAVNEEEQTATGVALRPYELDHQLDFVYPEGVEAMYNPATDDGILHAAFPDDAAELEFSEVLEEDQEIDGEQFYAGDWVIRRKYHDDELWSFVGPLLKGFSIGGDVTEAEEFDSLDELPDEVTIPDEVDPDAVDEKYWPPAGIKNGATSEISDVDIPAVVSATHTAKGNGLEKNLYDNASDRDEFVETMARRGAPEEGAGELYDYLETLEKTAPDGAVSKFFDNLEKQELDPEVAECKDSVLEDNPDMSESEAIAVCRSQLDKADTNDMSNSTDEDDSTEQSVKDLDDESLGRRIRNAIPGLGGSAESDDGVSPSSGQSEVSATAFSKAMDVVKEGRSLNADNREALMAAHDAIETTLESDLDIQTNRFTDDPNTDFDIAQYGDTNSNSSESSSGTEKNRDVEKLTEEQGDLVLNAIQRFVDNQGEAPFREFREWLWSTDVLDDDTTFAADEAGHQYRQFVREQRDQTPVTEDFLEWVEDESDTDTEITMSKDDTENEDEKSLAEQNAEQIDELTDTVKDLTEAVSGEGDGNDGAEKNADGGEDENEDEKSQAEKNAEAISELAESVETLAKASGHSQQLDYDGEAEKNADEEPDDGEVKKSFLGIE